MFKTSLESSQLNIFNSPKSIFSGNSIKMHEDRHAWHNQFRQQVTMRIDENIFRPFYCQGNGTPNSSIRILVAMMVLKEAEGLSDQKIFENFRFNLQVRSAIGLYNAGDPLPTESTYYLFRLEGNKVVYICSSEEVKSRFQELCELIYKILPLFPASISTHYQTLWRVFKEQYRVDEKKSGRCP